MRHPLNCTRSRIGLERYVVWFFFLKTRLTGGAHFGVVGAVVIFFGLNGFRQFERQTQGQNDKTQFELGSGSEMAFAPVAFWYSLKTKSKSRSVSV
jgi:hypothetical protein